MVDKVAVSLYGGIVVLYRCFFILDMSFIPLSEILSKDGEDAIETYFKLGYSYSELLHLLGEYHGIKLSIRQLHQILRGKKLYRRGHNSNTNDVIAFVD